MLDLIVEKKNQMEKLQQEIEKLRCEIEVLKLKEEYNVTLNIWYKTKDETIFFMPKKIDNEFSTVVGVVIKLDENELAYNLDEDSFSLDGRFTKMQVSSYGEMLNAVNLHNLEVLERHK